MGSMFQQYAHIQPCHAKISVLRSDEITRRAHEAMNKLEGYFEEEEFVQLSNAMREEPRIENWAIPLHAMCLVGESSAVQTHPLCQDGLPVQVDFSHPLSITNPSQRGEDHYPKQLATTNQFHLSQRPRFHCS